MSSFHKGHLQAIRTIFTDRTGVQPPRRSPARPTVRRVLLLAAVLTCCLTLSAFAVNLFSSLSGDELSLSATYQGNGLVSIQVENRSDKVLCFQPKLKLMQWSTSQEIQPLSGTVLFEGTTIEAHTSGTMTVDLSSAYDLSLLEQPLTNDHYYFVLTNNNFLFGQDWMCSVEFAPSPKSVQQEPQPLSPSEADTALAGRTAEALQPYFDTYITDPDARRDKIQAYYADCQALLRPLGDRLVSPASLPLLPELPAPDVPFDESVPAEYQLSLIGADISTLDAYGIPVGGAEGERVLVLNAHLPQYKSQSDGGAPVPLLYLMTYETADLKSPQDYTLIHGQLLTFAQLEPYKVYQDEQFVCYDVTHLFYTDLRQHVESVIRQRTDIYYDDQVWARVEHIYAYFQACIKAGSFSLPGTVSGQ